MIGDANDPVVRSDELDKRMEEAGIPALEGLKKHIRRQQHILAVVSAVLLCVIVLAAIVALVAVKAENAANKAELASRTAYANCVSQNAGRAAEKALWEKYINYPLTLPTPASIASHAAKVEEFQAYLNANLQPRDCSKLVGQ